MRRPRVRETRFLKSLLLLPFVLVPLALPLRLRGDAILGASALYALFASGLAIWLRNKTVEAHWRAARSAPAIFAAAAAASFLGAAFAGGFEGGVFELILAVAASGVAFWVATFAGYACLVVAWAIWRGVRRARLIAP